MTIQTKLIITLIAGIIIGAGTVYVYTPKQEVAHVADTSTHEQSAYEAMTATLIAASTSATFDKVFLEEMIMHHEGALSMATLAQTHATLGEVRWLSGEIIKAQTREIAMMKSWLAEKFPSVATSTSATHGTEGEATH